MAVESNIRNTIAHQMVGSAYGELLQKCTLVDESRKSLSGLSFSENEDGTEKSSLIRIKAGEKRLLILHTMLSPMPENQFLLNTWEI